MHNVEYNRILNSIEEACLPSQLDSIMNWIENFEAVFGKEQTAELRQLVNDKLNTFE